jgi:BolA protein
MNALDISEDIKNNILLKIDNTAHIEITDETYKHQKHKGFQQDKYHFLLEIKSDKLSSMTRIKSHKEIFSSVNHLMPSIHALSIKIVD